MISTSKRSNFIPCIGIALISSTALLTSIAILITNEHVSEIKIRYTKLRNWKNFITILFEKTLETSMVDKKVIKRKLRN